MERDESTEGLQLPDLASPSSPSSIRRRAYATSTSRSVLKAQEHLEATGRFVVVRSRVMASGRGGTARKTHLAQPDAMTVKAPGAEALPSRGRAGRPLGAVRNLRNANLPLGRESDTIEGHRLDRAINSTASSVRSGMYRPDFQSP